MQIKKEKIILGVSIAFCAILLLLIIPFVFRDNILKMSLSGLSDKFKTNYNCELTIKKSRFDGLFTIYIDDVSLTPKDSDTILKFPRIKISLNFLPLLIGNLNINTLEITGGYIQLTKKGDVKNFGSLLKKSSDNEKNEKKNVNYSKMVSNLIDKTISIVPDNIKIEKLRIKVDFNGNNAAMLIKSLLLENGKLEARISIFDDKLEQKCKVFGIADDKKLNIQVVSTENKQINIPFIEKEYKLLFGFNRIVFRIKGIDHYDGKLHIKLLSYISNLKLSHPKISTKKVFVKRFETDCNFLFGENEIALDNGSKFIINDIKIYPYISYNQEKDTTYTLQIKIPKINGQRFINSLPDGLFDNLKGMEVSGDFNYDFDFSFNKNKPDDMVLRSIMSKKKLFIIKYGRAKLNKLNDDFTYYAVVKNKPQRAIIVGGANSNFVPLNDISPLLVKCVLTSEDPSFFIHKGFINEAFKQSIIKNIRTQRFARGASTISMQLVKNVFLTREKTISRKLEEILLVYILENNKIVSKERMLEVYLNIIEWGPDVYGIAEASQFYFNKKPSRLSLNECLFLASIIPKPSKFMYKFDDTGELRSFAQKHNDFLLKTMYKRGLLLPQDTQSIDKFKISGKANMFLKSKEKDSSSIDSIPILPEEDFIF